MKAKIFKNSKYEVEVLLSKTIRNNIDNNIISVSFIDVEDKELNKILSYEELKAIIEDNKIIIKDVDTSLIKNIIENTI